MTGSAAQIMAWARAAVTLGPTPFHSGTDRLRAVRNHRNGAPKVSPTSSTANRSRRCGHQGSCCHRCAECVSGHRRFNMTTTDAVLASPRVVLRVLSDGEYGEYVVNHSLITVKLALPRGPLRPVVYLRSEGHPALGRRDLGLRDANGPTEIGGTSVVNHSADTAESHRIAHAASPHDPDAFSLRICAAADTIS